MLFFLYFAFCSYFALLYRTLHFTLRFCVFHASAILGVSLTWDGILNLQFTLKKIAKKYNTTGDIWRWSSPVMYECSLRERAATLVLITYSIILFYFFPVISPPLGVYLGWMGLRGTSLRLIYWNNFIRLLTDQGRLADDCGEWHEWTKVMWLDWPQLSPDIGPSGQIFSSAYCWIGRGWTRFGPGLV